MLARKFLESVFRISGQGDGGLEVSTGFVLAFQKNIRVATVVVGCDIVRFQSECFVIGVYLRFEVIPLIPMT